MYTVACFLSDGTEGARLYFIGLSGKLCALLRVEFLEMGAHIQCSSYFPGYYLTRNHNLIANSSKRKHNSSPDQFLGYYKEVIKQTMLEQEMILRDQV